MSAPPTGTMNAPKSHKTIKMIAMVASMIQLLRNYDAGKMRGKRIRSETETLAFRKSLISSDPRLGNRAAVSVPVSINLLYTAAGEGYPADPRYR